MIFEDDETVRMYVEESLEHLSNIENDLLAIEEGGADIDEDLVNSVFRAAHSIKGGAGFVGLTNIKNLAHKIENVLGMIRNKEMIPDRETISILLKGFDELKSLINNIEESENIDVAEHIVSLVGLTTASLPVHEKESVSKMIDIHLPDGTLIFQAPQFDIDQAVKSGKSIYLVEYDLINDIQQKNKTPLDVITMLMNSGIIIHSKIDIQSVGTIESGIPSRIPFYILFASIIDPELMPNLFDVDERYVHIIPASPPSKPGYKSNEVKSETAETEAIPDETAPDFLSNPNNSPEEDLPEPSNNTADEMIPDTPAMQTIDDLATDIDNQGMENASDYDPQSSTAQTTLRVHVSLLDSLMTLAGELVLSRNQMLQGMSTQNKRDLEIASQRINMVTSELQEAIMRTRMQPISNVFNKFPRIVRDLAMDMGKEIELSIEGKDVELDKTIIEAISDPLIHLVRNSVSHGIESPGRRSELGKDTVGKIKLSAYHEAGQVNIEIEDDGRGLSGELIANEAVNKGLLTEQQTSLMSDKEKQGIIFLPGFSTAEKVTELSGRGVGMDVVKTNMDKLGGLIDIDSIPGMRTIFHIKLPLTLAIIPSQIISLGNEKYAIPQVNLNELLRIPAAQVKNRIEKVGEAEVVRLRGNLLPLLDLSSVLGVKATFIDPDTGQKRLDRRQTLVDRRSKHSPYFIEDGEEEIEEIQENSVDDSSRDIKDRRFSTKSAINIAVVSAGTFRYGLVVDKFSDSEEIVVKPLGRHFKTCRGYAGATIMGDGKVALILDIAGLAQMADLSSLEGTDRVEEVAQTTKAISDAEKPDKDSASLLLFRNAVNEQFAVPLGLVERIERINTANIEIVGGKKVVQYRGGTLPLFALSEVADVKELPDKKQLEVIVFIVAGREIGLMVTPPVDAVDVSVNIDSSTLKQSGIMGSTIINNHTTLMVDMFQVVKSLNPEWFSDHQEETIAIDSAPTILFAEDSDFFRNQVKGYLEDAGYNVLVAEDGLVAWEILREQVNNINIILTDLEMPTMDGFELTSKIKSDKRFSHLPVIALSSLAETEDLERGKEVGIDDYQLKLDRDKLIESVSMHLKM